MSHFAKVENGSVTQVIVAEQDVIDSGLFGDPSLWIQTSYNTYGGKHPEGRPLRMNYAGIGYSYDSVKDAFIPPKPFSKWVLNDQTCLWEPPIPVPDLNNLYEWDDAEGNWKFVLIAAGA
jgi:hypothetical protein